MCFFTVNLPDGNLKKIEACRIISGLYVTVHILYVTVCILYVTVYILILTHMLLSTKLFFSAMK